MLEIARTLARGNPWAFQAWYEDLTPEERLGLKSSLVFDEVRKAIEVIADVLDQIYQAIVKAIQAIIEWTKTFFPILFEQRYRLLLYDRLSRWHLPHWLAYRLARYWLRRWLLP